MVETKSKNIWQILNPFFPYKKASEKDTYINTHII